MGWWGKLIGGTVGFMLGGPLGAVLGTAMGHGFDLAGGGGLGRWEYLGYRGGDSERVKTAFFTATFSVMGHISKADGTISTQEIAAAQRVMANMQLSPEQQRIAINLFNKGKSADFPIDEILEQFRAECHGRGNLIRIFVEILLGTAMADGAVNEQELRVLYYVCERLGYPREEFERILRMTQAGRNMGGGGFGTERDPDPGIKNAYEVLGLSEEATDDEVKKAYRHYMNQYHPDKLVSKGLPEEMMKFATEKTQKIKAAYDQIKKVRNIA